MAGIGSRREPGDSAVELLELYQDLIEEGVLEDMELHGIDPIRMVSEEMARFIRKVMGDPEPQDQQGGETAVFASSILAAAEALPQKTARNEVRKKRLEEAKAPLQRSIDLLTKIISDEKSLRVSKESLRLNVEILRKSLAKLNQSE